MHTADHILIQLQQLPPEILKPCVRVSVSLPAEFFDAFRLNFVTVSMHEIPFLTPSEKEASLMQFISRMPDRQPVVAAAAAVSPRVLACDNS